MEDYDILEMLDIKNKISIIVIENDEDGVAIFLESLLK